jgi:co-chaperonin GroES (HSP10)
MNEIEATKRGIILPDSAKERPAERDVVAVGAGKVQASRRCTRSA